MTGHPGNRFRRLRTLLFAIAVAVAAYYAWTYRPVSPRDWSAGDVAMLQTLSLGALPAVPSDPSNAVADDPAAVMMGNRLFFDTRLSRDNSVSCATCHVPERAFTDGLHRGRGIGESERNTHGIIAAAYSPWLYWDGRRDSLWSQALSPLEDPEEHGSNRMAIARLVTTDPTYGQMYESLFGPAPDFSDPGRFPQGAAPVENTEHANAWASMSGPDREIVNTVFANTGKAIAAFERSLVPAPTRFDAYLDAVINDDASRQEEIFDEKEVLGLQLFIGKARCTECHNGPLLTNQEFHNTGLLSFPGELPDRGRINGVRELLADPFNCLGAYSDDPDRNCPELAFVRRGPELLGAFRTPTLRNLLLTAPYMHKGQLATLADVLEHYNRAPDAMIGHNEAKPLKLSRPELARLEAFLKTLSDVPPDEAG